MSMQTATPQAETLVTAAPEMAIPEMATPQAAIPLMAAPEMATAVTAAARAAIPLAPHKDPLIIELATTALHDLTDLVPSVRCATILTEDGFEVDGVPADEDDRLSTMASSIQALTEAVARELTIGAAHYVIIAADGGHVIQLRVPGQQLVLAAVFDLDETLGKALAACRIAAEKFAMALDLTHRRRVG